MIVLRFAERVVRAALVRWRELSLDAKVIGVLAVANWLLLFGSDTIVQVTRDAPIWQMFPGLTGPLYLFVVGAAAVAYPLRDLRARSSFDTRARWRHLALLVVLFVILPALVAVVLRATGKPYTYIHDGALMAEEAAKKLLAGQNPYSVDYLDTPLFYWPMVNNPALYHFTYFPLLFLVTIPPLLALQPLGFFDERLLFVPAFVGCLWATAQLVRASSPAKLAAVGAVLLNPQFFPFVAEGRNDAFVLFFVFLTLLCLQRERLTLAGLALAAASGLKLHAVVLVPFVFAYLLARRRPRSWREGWRAIAPAAIPFALVSAVVFVPFLVWNLPAFWNDIVLYNAGGAAWSYPVSGIGFSMLLHALGVIPYRTADFPFWAFEIGAGLPVAILTLRRVWREPSLPTMVFAYGLTLLTFLFFGRYFQTSYLGYIVAVATPALFLLPARRPVLTVPVAAPAAVPTQAAGEP